MNRPRILIAGIGNIFLGDDGFGSETARRLALSPQPAGVRVVDYGIRGLDLAYALLDGADVALLIDASPRGQAPGTVSVVEPDLGFLEASPPAAAFNAHTMEPLNVLRMAKAFGAELRRVLLVACEPQDLGDELEGRIGLTPPVEAAVEQAVEVVHELVRKLLAGESLEAEEGCSGPLRD